MSGELRENRVAGNCISWGDEAPKSEIYHIYCSSVTKYQMPVKESAFWKAIRGYANMFSKECYKSVAGKRFRTIQVCGLEAGRFIFDASNGLKVDWAEFDESKTEDVFDDVWEADNE